MSVALDRKEWRLPGLHYGISFFLFGVLCTLTVRSMYSFTAAFAAQGSSGSTGIVPTTMQTEIYLPAPIELYVMENTVQLGLDSEANPSGCNLWKKSKDDSGKENGLVVPDGTRFQFEQYLQELKL